MHWYRPKLTAEAEGVSQESQGSSCPLITFLLTRPKKKLGIPFCRAPETRQFGCPDLAIAEIPTNSVGHGIFQQIEATPRLGPVSLILP
jgi:hypothetical protein